MKCDDDNGDLDLMGLSQGFVCEYLYVHIYICVKLLIGFSSWFPSHIFFLGAA